MTSTLLLLSAILLQGDPAIAEACGKLGDSSFEIREKATEVLTKIGKPALASLDGLSTHADPEVRSRAAGIARRIRARLRDAALQLRITLDPPQPVAGRPFAVILALVNKGDEALVLARVQHAPLFCPDVSFTLTRGKERLMSALVGTQMSCMTTEIGKDWFMTLDPGAAVEIYRFTLGGPGGNQPQDLVPIPQPPEEDWRQALQEALAAGEHRLEAAYDFRHRVAVRDPKDRRPAEWTFDGDEAAALHEKAWRGTASADVRFTVNPKEGASK